jgi:hypothetical protein
MDEAYDSENDGVLDHLSDALAGFRDSWPAARTPTTGQGLAGP